jgi:hypothetical protein
MSSNFISKQSREESIKQNLLEAKRNAAEATQYGQDTLEQLEVQAEHLRSTEDTLEANESIISQSMKTLRGMTWGGYLYNQFNYTADAINSILPQSENQPRKAVLNVPIPAENTSQFEIQQSNKEINATLFSSTHGPGLTQVKQPDHDDLSEISSALVNLHQMGVEIGQQLEHQNATIDSIALKTEQVTEQTIAVTIKASQLNDRSRPRPPQFEGIYQFVDTQSGKFLAVEDEKLVLTGTVSRSTHFCCFLKEKCLFGFRSDKFGKFMGCAMLGNIIVYSDTFGATEQVYFDFKAQSSGILFIARNWGAGGWLKRPMGELSATASADASTSTIPTEKAAPSATSKPSTDKKEIMLYLTETTSSISDRGGMILFRPIKVPDKNESRPI